MKSQTTKLYHWATEKASSSKAPLWIGLLFALEIVLFIPLDAILLFFCLQAPRKTFLYVSIAAFASVFSATIGYLLGHLLWDLISSYVVPYLVSTAAFDRLTSHFQIYEEWAVFFGALLPFPLKALTLVAGVFHLKFLPFLSAILTARLLRFSIIGAAALIGGEKVKQFVDRHFHRIILLVGAKIAAAFAFFWFLAA
ncbi:MAG TPA: VTT domain-containing protein [Chlamydiales bacterium]|jgi:membrane protein YqaA with SNARE-associated domain